MGERVPGTHWIGGWVNSRTDLDAEERRKISYPAENESRFLGRPAGSLVDWTVKKKLLTNSNSMHLKRERERQRERARDWFRRRMSVSTPSGLSGGAVRLKGVYTRTVLCKHEIFWELEKLFPYATLNIRISIESMNTTQNMWQILKCKLGRT